MTKLVDKPLTDLQKKFARIYVEAFYGKEGMDYLMDVAGIAIQWGATKVGGALLDKCPGFITNLKL